MLQKNECLPVIRLVLSKAGKARKNRCEEQQLCCGCLRPAHGRMIRGLHQYCRRLQVNAEARGEVTEEKLMRDGKLFPAASPGSKRTNPLARELYGDPQ